MHSMTNMDRRGFLATSAGAALVAASPALAQPALVQTAGAQDARLLALLDRIFNEEVDDSPERATSLGLDKGPRAALKSHLDDNSSAERARQLELTRGRVAALKAIDRRQLSAPSKVDYDVVVYQQQNALTAGDRYKFGHVGGRFVPYVISQESGAYQDIPDFLDNQHKVETAADADAYLSRLHEFARALDQDTQRFREDTGTGVIPPDFMFDLAMGQMHAIRDKPAAESVLVSSLVGKARKAGLTGDYGAQAAKIVAGEVYPALDRQMAAVSALRPRATSDAGVWKVKGGEAYYADALKAATTTDLPPEEIHKLGLDQVADTSARIDAILKAKGMTQGTVGARLAALNEDPAQLYPNTDEGRAALISWLNDQIASVYKMLPQAFATLPKAKVEVRRVPPFIQDGAANGYYQSAALDGSRPALYFINLKDTHDWPKFGLPTLTYHEAVPGHHLQISLAQESTRIPILRRTGGGLSAYTEGWALYSEQLAYEMGVYGDDPLGQAGFWQSLLFRAARLVVDTGIHSKHWSREQATQYMVDTTGYARGRSQREVERYCGWPGQACSYKVGHTVWMRVRGDAKRRLGPKFDLRAYHDAALLSGAMPMTVLEQHMSDWVARQA
jgi:uncharacterized protein (DUF885 family)